ncbi:hypothetical protein SAMN04487849_10595 [Micrococcus luteus]|uniref:Uncharacterized protein n=2 Tax=Micrococcus luteus TaxID=1270 RepID=A0ABD7M785_MICLU|nr:hypothetical protein [Micrococcus luteus]MBY0171248.1 hypothetical protein [Micrococcus luteus]MCT1812311.1 hypothetical protein [Micrococcus luteus]MCV7464585.1 hypothetical protein [Micrococcus luteus]MCV7604043.1 hypothetical protein [Micrococcus luteus]MCV7622894.1 hypothetical protein [Micrococcus luteus]
MHPVLPSPRRGRAALGLAAVALVALSACARTEPQPEPAPATTAASALPSMDMAPFTVEVPSHDLERVPEASVAVLEGEDPDHHGAWLQVSGAPAWTDAMAGAVRDQIDQYRRDTDPSADPRLEIQPQLAVVAEDIAAARLLATERRGTDSVSTSHVIWYSAREDRVLETADLFTPDGWDAFRTEVRQRMANDPDVIGSRLDSAVDAPEQVENRRVWDAVVFLPDGSLMLEADQASMAPAAAGVLTVRIPRDTATAWLSDLGHVAADAASAPADLRLPDRSTPTPEEQQPEPAPEPEPETSSWTAEATGAPVPPPSTPAETAAPTPSVTTPVPSSSAPSSSAPAPTRSATPSSPSSPPTSSSPSGTGSGSPTPSTPDPTPTSATPTPTSPTPTSPSPSGPSTSASGPSTSAPATDPAPDPTESAPEPTATTASASASPTSGDRSSSTP